MKNSPHISNFDLGVFGNPTGPVFSYRRVRNVINDGVEALGPDEPWERDAYFAVYRWDDNAGPDGEWQWVGDTNVEAVARQSAVDMAGTDTPFKPD